MSVGELSEEENDVSRGESSTTQQSQGEQLENQTIPHERGNKGDGDVNDEAGAINEMHNEDVSTERNSFDSQDEHKQ